MKNPNTTTSDRPTYPQKATQRIAILEAERDILQAQLTGQHNKYMDALKSEHDAQHIAGHSKQAIGTTRAMMIIEEIHDAHQRRISNDLDTANYHGSARDPVRRSNFHRPPATDEVREGYAS